MIKPLVLLVLALSLSSSVLTVQGQDEDKSTTALPPARKIPAITAEDPYPNGCIDCHINYVEMNLDTRFSTLMKQLNDGVEPVLLAKVKASCPSGVTLKGKHPDVSSSLKDIPASCLKCHGKESNIAPPFSRLMHRIHLSGGEENHFLTIFQGECTYCHKLDLSTGQWSLHSGSER